MFVLMGFFCRQISWWGEYLDDGSTIAISRLHYRFLGCPERADEDKLPVIFSWQDSVIVRILQGHQSFNHLLLRNYPPSIRTMRCIHTTCFFPSFFRCILYLLYIYIYTIYQISILRETSGPLQAPSQHDSRGHEIGYPRYATNPEVRLRKS